ncbi:MAG: TIGR00730 family Rossman fold protein [Acidimicrobiaceae bacterium]|nr:TIGR00730 family Rossman fold protein [Acidimicrobiaceae bacterium]
MPMSGNAPRQARLCVYCGSNFGSSPAFRDAAHALGEAMARRGITLVYGGGQVGLMGVVADAALAAGGDVIGVITEQLVSAEVAHRGVTALEVVPDMHQRKARFEQLSDGFVALPGGFGTVEEVIELLTWNQLGIVRKPVVLFDVERFWGSLFDWMDTAVDSGFVRRSHRMLAQRAHTADEALALALAPAPETPNKWLDRDTGQIPVIQGPPAADRAD